MDAKETELNLTRIARIARRAKEAEKAEKAEGTKIVLQLARSVLLRRDLRDTNTSHTTHFNRLIVESNKYNKYSDKINISLNRSGLIVKKGDILSLIRQMETLLALVKMGQPTQESLVEKINRTLERLRISLAKCNSYLNITSEKMSVMDIIKELTDLRVLAKMFLAKQINLSCETQKRMSERQIELRAFLTNMMKV